MTGFLKAVSGAQKLVTEDMKVSKLLGLAFGLHSTETFFNWEGKLRDGEITGACTLGVMALLLGLDTSSGPTSVLAAMCRHPNGTRVSAASHVPCTNPELEAKFLEAFSIYDTVANLRKGIAVRKL